MNKKNPTRNKNHIQSSNTSSLYDKIKAFGLGITLIGSGFAAGRYYEHTQNTLEYNDKVLERNKELLRVQEEYDGVIHELRNQVYELQNELLNQKKNNNEKKK